MRNAQLDISKMTEEEREYYKTYVESLRGLKIRTFEEDMKELESRWNVYKEGIVSSASRVFGMVCSMKQILEELMEYDDDLNDIHDEEEEDELF